MNGRTSDIFRRRAARLARKDTDKNVAGTPVLVFRVGNERYGIELSHLAEVIPHAVCAPVPGAPRELAGVIQVRGEIRPVWELSRLLGLPDVQAECVLLLRAGARQAGLRVSGVEDIRALRPEECGPPLENSPHVKWITPDLITILNPAELVKKEET